MDENSRDRLSIARNILRQHLESLHRAGVRQLPSPPTPIATDVAETQQVTVAAQSAEIIHPDPMPRRAPATPSESAERVKAASLPMALAPPADRAARLNILQREVALCSRCPELASRRKQTVFGVGDPEARLCFFGEAPGADEDRQGEPFVGAAGQLLNKIIAACGLRREDVYILNVLKCRPPGNRNPLPEEVANCRTYFEQQLETIQPEFICCLGAVAAQTLLRTKQPIGRLRGRLHDYRGIRVLATYHPSYLLRTPSAKRATWEDMKLLLREMGLEIPSK
jgi:DNA polymerase